MSTIPMRNYPLLAYVGINSVATEWSRAQPYIMSAEGYSNELTEEEILGMIYQNQLHLFLVYNDSTLIGAATAQILRFPTRTIVQIVHLASDDFSVMSDVLDEFAHWAKAYEATALTLRGRPGWGRKLGHLGFKQTAIVMEKEI